jgi:hypothetical protein
MAKQAKPEKKDEVGKFKRHNKRRKHGRTFCLWDFKKIGAGRQYCNEECRARHKRWNASSHKEGKGEAA